jgi:HEAT repeat protein
VPVANPESISNAVRRTLPAVVVCLLRFAADPSADVRIAAAKGPAEHDDPRAHAALQRLAAADLMVRERAVVSLRELGQSG